MRLIILALSAVFAMSASGDPGPFTARDVFDLEYASSPRVSPDGGRVLYTRRSGDIMSDRFRSELWLAAADGSSHRPLVQEDVSGGGVWSPDGARVLYSASDDGEHELRTVWMDTREVTTVVRLGRGAGSAAWSPDGSTIAFTMFVASSGATPPAMPEKPEGAEWAAPARVIDRAVYRNDGSGFLEQGSTHVFVVPADGGTARQLTTGDSNHNGPLSWMPDSGSIVFSANRLEDWERDPIESDLYEVRVASGAITRLTERDGPDQSPAVSPDGSRIAYTGFTDRRRGYQVTELYVLDRSSGTTRSISGGLDRTVSSPVWSEDGRAVYAMYSDHGDTKVARFGLDGSRTVLAEGVGGSTLGRPYGAGSFDTRGGTTAAVFTTPTRPADVGVITRDGVRKLTALNEDVLGHRGVVDAEAFTVESSADGRDVQAWIMKPYGFKEGERYPMVLEIHGGPFADYGPRFSAENQLYAAAGYVVVYANPRGSTSYGEEFGDLIHHAYPGDDYHDLMSVVDGAIAMGFIDEDRLFVTGGSGGGVLTAWIVGNTDRFRAAVVAKPVINWISFALTADFAPFFSQYWLAGPVWEEFDHAWARSPLSLVGNVTTPTMLLTGEDDLRTPIAESEQYYQALTQRGVATRMVRIPGASHGIASRPSRLAAKIAHILAWFDEHDG